MTATTVSPSDVVLALDAGRTHDAVRGASDGWNAGWPRATAPDARDLLTQIEYGPAIAAAIRKVQTLLEADSASVCLHVSSAPGVQHILDGEQQVDSASLAAGAVIPRLAEEEVVQRRTACAACRLQPHIAWCASAPLYAEGRQIGMLCAIRRPPRLPFGREHLQRLQFLAFWAGIAIGNASKVHSTAQSQRSQRERIAAHLHDNAAHSLSIIGLKVDQIETALGPALPEEVRLHLAAVSTISQQLMAQVRAAFVDLREAAAQPEDLVTALAGCMDAFTAAAQLPVEFSMTGSCLLPAQVQAQAVQIVREALNNIAKHAHASRVQLNLHGDHKSVRIVLRDDGVGFDLDKVGADQRRLGTVLMRERAQRSGGALTIASHPGRGTQVTLVYPAALLP